MASLRQQAADYNAKFGKKLVKGKAVQSFKGLGKSAAYRGAAGKALRATGDATAAHKAGMAADKGVAKQRARLAEIDAQFKGRRGKAAAAERAAAVKEASQGGSM